MQCSLPVKVTTCPSGHRLSQAQQAAPPAWREVVSGDFFPSPRAGGQTCWLGCPVVGWSSYYISVTWHYSQSSPSQFRKGASATVSLCSPPVHTSVLCVRVCLYGVVPGLCCHMWVQFPDQGSNPGLLPWDGSVLATRPAGRSPHEHFKIPEPCAKDANLT